MMGLRVRLTALVATWRQQAERERTDHADYPAFIFNRCADELDTLLCETPEAGALNARLDWFLHAEYSDVMGALIEDGSLLEDIRAEIRSVCTATPEDTR
jgi:hypothetical protein